MNKIIEILTYGLERKYPAELDGYKYYKTKVRLIHPLGFIMFIALFLYYGISFIVNDFKDEFCIF